MSDYWKENNLVKPPQIVVCAANKLPVAGGFVILCGARHWDKVMCKQADVMGLRGGDEQQGFIDQFGDFLTREEAMVVVKESGQPFNIERNVGDICLFSEGLY